MRVHFTVKLKNSRLELESQQSENKIKYVYVVVGL